MIESSIQHFPNEPVIKQNHIGFDTPTQAQKKHTLSPASARVRSKSALLASCRQGIFDMDLRAE